MTKKRVLTSIQVAPDAGKAGRHANPPPKKKSKMPIRGITKQYHPRPSKSRRPKTPTPTPTPSATASPQPPLPTVPSPIIDAATEILILLNKEYELQTFVYLDKEHVSSQHEFRKLNSFNFQQFLAESIKTTAQRTQNCENTIEWIRGEAKVQYSRLPKDNHAVSDVYDDGEWKRVENTVKEWMMASKPSIRVDLSLHFKKKVFEVSSDPKTSTNTSIGGTFNANSNPNTKITKPPHVSFLFSIITD